VIFRRDGKRIRRQGEYRVYHAADGWRWRLVAVGNNEIVAQATQAYGTATDAARGAEDARRVSRRAAIRRIGV
jgi:uncharacterized protein YegP (UPF0339 family)